MERESVTILKTDFTKPSLSLTVDSNGLDTDNLATADERVELCALLQMVLHALMMCGFLGRCHCQVHCLSVVSWDRIDVASNCSAFMCCGFVGDVITKYTVSQRHCNVHSI